jgi:cation:H+ antiporter
MVFLLILMSVAAELIVKGAEILEHKFGSVFVGAIVLGFITTFPELLFVIIAVLAMEQQIALGSAIGGNILLFTLGYGLVITLAYLRHREMVTLPKTIHDDLLYLLFASLFLLFATLFDGILDLFDALVLTTLDVIYVIHQLVEARNLTLAKVREEAYDEHIDYETVVLTRKNYFNSFLLLLIGGILILIVAEPFVHSISVLSVEFGISALFLALVISPFASEMPEKISAYILTYKSMKGAEMAISNFVGSKVQNNTLLFGLMTLTSIIAFGEGISTNNEVVSMLFMVLTTIVGVIVTYDLKLNKKEGIGVLTLYFLVIFILYAGIT